MKQVKLAKRIVFNNSKIIRPLVLATGLLISASTYNFAQNLTMLNPSFESYIQCPTGLTPPGGTMIISNWIQTTNSTSDYFNSNCSFLPANMSSIWPYSNATAANGNGFLGMFMEVSNPAVFTNNPGYKEYVTNTLSGPMVAGKVYKISFKVRVLSGTASNGTQYGAIPLAERGYLGLLFTAANPRNTYASIDQAIPANYFPNQRTYIPASHAAYTSTNGWTSVELNYTAQGGEQFMTLGQFRVGASSNYGFNREAYYFFDDFSTVQEVTCSAGNVAPVIN